MLVPLRVRVPVPVLVKPNSEPVIEDEIFIVPAELNEPVCPRETIRTPDPVFKLGPIMLNTLPAAA